MALESRCIFQAYQQAGALLQVVFYKESHSVFYLITWKSWSCDLRWWVVI